MDKVGRERINGKRRVPAALHRKPGRGQRSDEPAKVRALAIDAARHELTVRLREALGVDEADLVACVKHEIDCVTRRTRAIVPTGPAGATNHRRLALVVGPEYDRLSDRELAALSILADIPTRADYDGDAKTGRDALRDEEKRIRNARLYRAGKSPRDAQIDRPRRPKRSG